VNDMPAYYEENTTVLH